MMVLVAWLFRQQTPHRVDRYFRRMQLVSAAIYSLAHGGNDAQKTMGSGITRLQPIGGFCAETAAATTIIAATHGGVPISTTHAITGAILGVGTTRGVRSVRWIWGQRIVIAWILTIPCSAFMAATTYFLVHLTGVWVTMLILTATCLGLWLWKRKKDAAEDPDPTAEITAHSPLVTSQIGESRAS